MLGFITDLRECLIDEGPPVTMQDLDGNPLRQVGGEDDQEQRAELDLDGPTWVDDHTIFTIARDRHDVVDNISI